MPTTDPASRREPRGFRDPHEAGDHVESWVPSQSPGEPFDLGIRRALAHLFGEGLSMTGVIAEAVASSAGVAPERFDRALAGEADLTFSEVGRLLRAIGAVPHVSWSDERVAIVLGWAAHGSAPR